MSDVTDDRLSRQPSLKATRIHNTPTDGTRTTEPALWSTREVAADVPADASYEYDKDTVVTDCKVVHDLSMVLSE
jgi:hypothetical protein